MQRKKIFSNKHRQMFLGGLMIGLLNGLLGAGGGMLAVPLLKKNGLSQQEAQSTAVAVICPLSLLSALAYWLAGHLSPAQALPFLLPGAVGALGGALLLRKIPAPWLRKAFAVFMIWAGLRMVLP